MPSNAPDIAFLGICQKTESFRTDDAQDWTYHILGLRSSFQLPVYPASLQDYELVFAIYNIRNLEQTYVRIINESGVPVSGLDLNADDRAFKEIIFPNSLASTYDSKWEIYSVRINPPFPIMSPGIFQVVLSRNNEEVPIGCISFTIANVPPLTQDEINWLRLNPDTAGKPQLMYECSECADSLKVYTGLERSEQYEKEGFVWYSDLPDTFECRCKKLSFDLTYIRSNMHALLKHAVKPDGDKSLIEQYHNNVIDVKRIEFQFLLDLLDDTSEERVQQFLKDNPVFLSIFSPIKILFKAPILSKYKTDIVILNHKKELLLIELEKPGKSLLKRDGGISSELQHPFDQVRSWLDEVDEHRAAVLSGFDLSPSDVGLIRGVVIMGRDKGYNPEHLRKLKKRNFGDITFYTYDDLIMGLSSLARSFRSI